MMVLPPRVNPKAAYSAAEEDSYTSQGLDKQGGSSF